MFLLVFVVELFYIVLVGVEMWLVSMKIDNICCDDVNVFNFYFMFEYGFFYLLNVGLCYINLEVDFVLFDKIDYIFYYLLFNCELMKFDVGIILI